MGNKNSVLNISTFGELKKSGYIPKNIKDELRDNLILKLKNKEELFQGIKGYEDTVMPDIERAILSRHSMNLLGLRGQAKTRMARSLTQLLDEYIPALEEGDLNDDPFDPISAAGKKSVADKGDSAPIRWIHRSVRYVEKLATPDVSVADLIGDVDPIKAANMRLDYSDERVIHYGLVPRSNRCIFVINELPDLQARIQVSLFNILQEGDIQIRGFQIRLPLDIQFVFTANPEDYTQRGAIITPLKDRIQSQILTHYPKSIDIAKEITAQEARISESQKKRVFVPEIIADIVEQLAFEARDSEYVDQKSGVSARMSITAFENLLSAAERRAILNDESSTVARFGDLIGVIPAMTGKVELVYEGEVEGPRNVAYRLIGSALRKKMPQLFPDPEMVKKKKMANPYEGIIAWFTENELEIESDESDASFKKKLSQVTGLKELINKYLPGLNAKEQLIHMEFVLHALSEFSLISKHQLDGGISFSDLFNSLFSDDFSDEN